jgi:hypothetical protein
MREAKWDGMAWHGEARARKEKLKEGRGGQGLILEGQVRKETASLTKAGQHSNFPYEGAAWYGPMARQIELVGNISLACGQDPHRPET